MAELSGPNSKLWGQREDSSRESSRISREDQIAGTALPINPTNSCANDASKKIALTRACPQR